MMLRVVWLIFFMVLSKLMLFFFSSRRRHTRYIGDWSSDVCSSDLLELSQVPDRPRRPPGPELRDAGRADRPAPRLLDREIPRRPLRLGEARSDQLKGVGHQAVRAPAQQTPCGDRIVDRPAKQAIARLLDRPGLVLAQMPLIAMKTHAVKCAQLAWPVRRHLIHEETARQVRGRCPGGFERDARERR